MIRSVAVFVFLLASTLVFAQCAPDHDHRSNKSGGLFVTDLIVTGTQSVTSDELNKITGKLVGSCYNDDSEDLEEYIRLAFQDRGYTKAKVSGLHIKLVDPLAVPKPSILEAEVEEGLLYKFAGVQFSNNRAFSESELRDQFSLKKGDVVNVTSVGAGIRGVRQLYRSQGYLDWTATSDAQFSGATAIVTLVIEEGKQYRMGKLVIGAKKELADVLQGRWTLAEGAPYDADYIGKYLDENHALLPMDFTQAGNVHVARNCPDATVEVDILLDPAHGLRSPAKDVECDPPGDAEK